MNDGWKCSETKERRRGIVRLKERIEPDRSIDRITVVRTGPYYLRIDLIGIQRH